MGLFDKMFGVFNFSPDESDSDPLEITLWEEDDGEITDVVIKTHDFELSKDKIRQFSKETTTDLDLKRVSSDKDVGEVLWDAFWGKGLSLEHTVTGGELNELTSQIQKNLISINETQRKFIKEFGQVYNALEALDKDYIQSIVISIKSAQEANKKAKKVRSGLIKAVEEQKKIIRVLQQHKDKIDSFEHILDIDNMWEAFQELENRLNQSEETLSALDAFKTSLEQLGHISDIDEIWECNLKLCGDIETLNQNFSQLNENLTTQSEQIKALIQKQQKLDNIKHLSDVDTLWEEASSFDIQFKGLKNTCEMIEGKVSENEKGLYEIGESLGTITRQDHIYHVDAIFEDTIKHGNQINKLYEEKNALSNSLEDMNTVLMNDHNQLIALESNFANRINKAYLIAGCSLCLALLELIVMLSGVL